MATDAVVRTAGAKEVTGRPPALRIVDGALLYAYDMAAVGQPKTPHLSARLERVAASRQGRHSCMRYAGIPPP
jgi:hypothetical protein